MKYRWMLGSAAPEAAARLGHDLGISPLLAQCLLNRGLAEPDPARHFLEPRLKRLADPFGLPDMAAAVDRLLEARARREAVTIFGDYDVDGVTATALLLEVLRPLGWTVEAYLPHRLDEGYGLSQDAVENCLQRHPARLLLAVDCGSTAVASIAWLQTQGVDVVVLDHHQVSDPAPAAVALVNPHRAAPDTTGAEALSSVGLAFKLAHALLKRARAHGDPAAATFDLRPLLDLVALGTVADLVPLTGENRILVAAGLERLAATRRPGLIALKEVAQVREPIGAHEIGFQLGPRLNAAGRLETAHEALQLLLAPDAATATPIAATLDTRNRERQQIERHIAEQVIGAVRARFNPATDFVIVEGQLLWHIGVVGIVASRVLQEFYRPTLILGGEGDTWRGSGRSIEGFDLAAALRACGDLLLRHGGHALAAGLSLHPDRLDAFRGRLNALAREQLRPEQLQPSLRLDARVPLAELSVERLEELGRLRPTGQGNREVQLLVGGLTHRRPPQHLGRAQQHAKFWVRDGPAAAAEAVWWGGGDKPWPEGRFDLACVPQVNAWSGRPEVQLRVLDWRPAAA